MIDDTDSGGGEGYDLGDSEVESQSEETQQPENQPSKAKDIINRAEKDSKQEKTNEYKNINKKLDSKKINSEKQRLVDLGYSQDDIDYIIGEFEEKDGIENKKVKSHSKYDDDEEGEYNEEGEEQEGEEYNEDELPDNIKNELQELRQLRQKMEDDFSKRQMDKERRIDFEKKQLEQKARNEGFDDSKQMMGYYEVANYELDQFVNLYYAGGFNNAIPDSKDKYLYCLRQYKETNNRQFLNEAMKYCDPSALLQLNKNVQQKYNHWLNHYDNYKKEQAEEGFTQTVADLISNNKEYYNHFFDKNENPRYEAFYPINRLKEILGNFDNVKEVIDLFREVEYNIEQKYSQKMNRIKEKNSLLELNEQDGRSKHSTSSRKSYSQRELDEMSPDEYEELFLKGKI